VADRGVTPESGNEQEAKPWNARSARKRSPVMDRVFIAHYPSYRKLGYTRWQAFRVLWRSRRFLNG
jgi:hypothetical protein